MQKTEAEHPYMEINPEICGGNPVIALSYCYENKDTLDKKIREDKQFMRKLANQ
ncbi:hypothetical protein G4O51_07740 [Candidatus Bathyarchaeota archaeon A05DMB-2]|nr:hypothetical protein [Candidatus Bathyarchaeota archaeon A05DMB-2]